MRNVLVIGGAGYVGGVTSSLFHEKGYNVTVFDNLLYEERFLKDIPFIFGDIRDTEHLKKIHRKFDTIVWLAAIVGDAACAQDPELTFEINYHSIKRFIEATNRRVIFPSTCSVYGAQHEMLSEKSETKPLSLYAKTKLMAEGVVLAHNGLAFRLGTLFGVGDNYSRLRLDLVVNYLTYKAVRENSIKVFGGEQWRPILSVYDAAMYFLEAVTRDYNDVFNLCMRNIRIVDLAKIISSIFPDLKIEAEDIEFEDARNYRVITEKADSHFIHKPSVNIENEVFRIRDLLVSRRIKNPENPLYYNTHYVKGVLGEIKDFKLHS
jgi:nucleoside-diphosphate-sugar epimerase